MKKKSNHQKEVEMKEVGIFDDFIIMEKEKKDLDDLSFLKEWINLENPFSKKAKPKKSRFSDLFKEMEEEEKESKNKKAEEDKKKEEDTKINEEEKQKKEEDTLKKDDSLKKNISFNSSTANTNFDSKLFESFSGNESSLENSNINISNNTNNNSINQIKENKKSEQREISSGIEEINLNLDINKVISLEDKRTTIMIKNIPNKFNKDLLLSIINQNFKGTYDLFILPTDVNKYKNFGYAFINFTCSYYIPYFYYMFNGKMWSSTNSKKVCELTYSKVQGRNNLLGHYPIKIVFWNEEASNVTPNQKYIIPNVYKIIFNKCFPKETIEEFKFYFITKMPGHDQMFFISQQYINYKNYLYY